MDPLRLKSKSNAYMNTNMQPTAESHAPAVWVDGADVDVTVDIDLKQVEEDTIITQVKPSSNEADMDAAALAVMARRREIRPKRTTKGYRKGLRCWQAFCARRQFTDADLVREKKILLFLKEDVLTMRTPMKRRNRAGKLSVFSAGKESLLESLPPPLPPMLPLTPETIEAGYISPLIDLWTEQNGLGLNPYPHPRGALLRGLALTLRKEKADQAREAFEDRAIGKLNDGYTVEEYHRLCSGMLMKKDQLGPWLRTRLDIQLAHAGVLRSESNRLAELPDLFMHQLGGEEGEGSLTSCVVVMFRDGKTLDVGRTDYTGLLRHKDPVLCPLASLALYLFWRFEVAREQPPNFNSRESWYNTKLIPGKQEQGSLSYETQALWTARAFADAGIHSSKITHTMRGASARIADAQGIPEDQVC
jgi:centromere DNA-binding complex CBF3 subunit-like protein